MDSQSLESIRINNDQQLEIIDQLLLPFNIKYIKITNVAEACTAIKKMQIRGAPAIAILGLLSIAIELKQIAFASIEDLKRTTKTWLAQLVHCRPTAVNIKNAESLFIEIMDEHMGDVEALKNKLIELAEKYRRDDIIDNKEMGRHGADSIIGRLESRSTDIGQNVGQCVDVGQNVGAVDGENVDGKLTQNMVVHLGDIVDINLDQHLVHDIGQNIGQNITLLTHCNTGSLATAGYGTALGVVRAIHERGRLKMCYFTETRPYNQGSRLTAFELMHDRIPSTLICDSMVATLMATRSLTAVVVGADRIASNGDTANKVGTLQIAILASEFSIPFYVVAPVDTFDFDIRSGREIDIENRPSEEMLKVGGVRIGPEGCECWNPAFDVTPCCLVTGGYVTEYGVFTHEQINTALKNIAHKKK